MFLKKTGFTPLEAICQNRVSACGAVFLTGFTLVEVLIATTIGAFIASVALCALKVVSASAEIVDDNIKATAEVRFASNMLARDLVNLYRDSDVRNMKFVGRVSKSGERPFCVLTFYTVGGTKARAGQPEGDIYEVEYYLLEGEEKTFLMRRLWPNPDPNEVEPRGVLTVIANGIDTFEARFFNGEEWSDEWPEEMQSVPELVEVSIAAIKPERKSTVAESFIVNFARFVGSEATTSGESGQAGSSGGSRDTGTSVGGTGQEGSSETSGSETEMNR